MTVEARPLGVQCNLQCQYCYQHLERDGGSVAHSYDLEKIKAGLEEEGGPFTLFGGEPLVMPEKDLEELWSWGFEKYGTNACQTNATLINDNHIRMFHKYRVHVGISVDGPGEFNDVRWAGTLEQTREATAKAHAMIERLCRERIDISLIVTLHRGNATPDKLPVLHDWFRHLDRLGVLAARLHILEVEDDIVRTKYALSTEEDLEAFLSFLTLEKELTTLKVRMFQDMRNLLLGRDSNVTCFWNACDPYTTRAVRGVEGDGTRSMCSRTSKDGIEFTRCGIEGLERYLALYHTAQEYGGCKGCRFFLMCKGQCPSTGLNGDWRNRSENCRLWKGIFRHLEEEMLEEGLLLISAWPDRKQLESIFLDTWRAGHITSIARALEKMREERSATESRPQSSHGKGDHGDASHGDIPHGDHHGDHTDHGVREQPRCTRESVPK